jgi:phage-related minor tail protein
MNIFELVGKIALEGSEETKRELTGIEAFAEKNRATFQKMGAAMTGVGAAVTGALGLAAKAAVDEEANISHLAAALESIGVSYADVGEDLEKYIAAQQTATAFADDQQRDALAALIPMVGDYEKAIELMGVTMDLARWKQIDLSTAADIVGKVAAGNLGTLSRYGIVMEQGATSAEALAKMQELAAGQAEAYGQTTAGQFGAMEASLGDLQERIGAALIPVLVRFLEAVTPIIEQVMAWIDENPELTNTIVLVTGAIGGLLTVLGPVLMALPGIVAAAPAVGAALAALTGPVGLVVAAIIGLIAAGVAIWKNWDAIKAKAEELGDTIRNLWHTLTGGIGEKLSGVGSTLRGLLPGFAEGGTISEPTLLYGLRSQRPYAIAGEAGVEHVVPAGGGSAGITINVAQLHVREEADVERVARELRRLAIMGGTA